jgi:hypothetical protein
MNHCHHNERMRCVASMQTSMDVSATIGGAADSRVVSKAIYIFHAGSSASSDDSDAPACNPLQPLLATEQQAPLSERLLDNCRCTYCAEVQKKTQEVVGHNSCQPGITRPNRASNRSARDQTRPPRAVKAPAVHAVAPTDVACLLSPRDTAPVTNQ